jgi:capsular exopolysaccharide synthesis family protein
VRPLKTHIILTSVFLGLILSVMLAFLLEHLDNTVRTGSDVESKLQAPLLGLLPWVREGRGKSELQRAFLEDTDHVFAEAVRTLRTGVLMSSLDSPHRTILVTSSLPEEGKTSVATNLALALAQLKRTCLVDADMRRPQLGRILGIDPAAPGLSQLISGAEPQERCIHLHRDSNLHIIPSGPVPANPLEILSSRRFGEVLKSIEESFDVVVFDSPPVQLVSDAVVLAGIAEALVFVVRADSTPYQVARGGTEILKNGRARLLGVVLNQVDFDTAERYYGYGEHYSHGGKYRSYKTQSRGDSA